MRVWIAFGGFLDGGTLILGVYNSREKAQKACDEDGSGEKPLDYYDVVEEEVK